MEGSNDITCDDNGVCNCKSNIINTKCDTCAAGSFGFPMCDKRKWLLGDSASEECSTVSSIYSYARTFVLLVWNEDLREMTTDHQSRLRGIIV